MVYGMRVRPSSGLTTNVKAVDGDFDKVKDLPDSEYFRVDPTFLPKRLQWLSRDRSPPDDFDRGAWFSVSARAKEAIEALEPDIHQFVPVEYLDKSGKHLEHRYWFFAGRIINSVDREHTNMIFHLNSWRPVRDIARRYPDLVPPGADLTAAPKLVFNLSQIGGAHMWYDRYLAGGKGSPPFISQSMHDHLQANGMTGIVYDAGQVEAVP